MLGEPEYKELKIALKCYRQDSGVADPLDIQLQLGPEIRIRLCLFMIRFVHK